MVRRGLTVEGAIVRYETAEGPAVTAVDGVDLQVAPGEVVALLGASGSGKSSLLRAIAGLEPLASGSVWWDDDELTGTPIHKRGFGMMFQDAALFPSMDVGRNVADGLHALPRAARRGRVEELLELVGLPGHEKRRVTELSGGQAQRVALARSLAPRPRLLLLDEPLSALDRRLRERLVDVLGEVLRATHTTAVYVTHDQDEAFTIADRVAVLAAGRLLQVDPPRRLWRHPESRAVASFLGYGPFLGPDAAAYLGLEGVAPGTVVGLGPDALVLDPDWVALAVLGQAHRRAHVEVQSRLPEGRTAELRLADEVATQRVRVGVDPDAVVRVPAEAD